MMMKGVPELFRVGQIIFRKDPDRPVILTRISIMIQSQLKSVRDEMSNELFCVSFVCEFSELTHEIECKPERPLDGCCRVRNIKLGECFNENAAIHAENAVDLSPPIVGSRIPG